MASIKRITHKNGRVVYRIVISLGYDSQGKKKVKNLTYAVNQSATPRQQEKEAMRYAMNLEDKMKYGYDYETSRILFEDFAAKWLENVRSTLAYGTYIGYEQLLRSRICPYFGKYRIAGIKTSDIEEFYKSLTGEYSAGTIKRAANVLSCIFGTARRWNIIEHNPCQYARKPKNRQDGEELRYFTPIQSLMFLKSLDMSYDIKYKRNPDTAGNGKACAAVEYIKAYKVPSQYRMFYLLSLFCGCRKGETLALCWDDIDFEGQQIVISKSIGRTERGFDCKEPKSASSVRKIPLPEKLCQELEAYRKEYETQKQRLGSSWKGDGSLFIRCDGRRMGPNTTYQYFVRHLRRYNQWVREHPERAVEKELEELPVIPLHGLRHSCATLLNYLEVNIVDISKYLGHANCSVTMNVYAHSFEAQKREASNRLNDFLQNSMK